jgi:hypothetical protein
MAQLSSNTVALLLQGQEMANIEAPNEALVGAGLEKYQVRARSPGAALRRAIRAMLGSTAAFEIRPLKNGRGFLCAWCESEGRGMQEQHSLHKSWTVGLTTIQTLESSGLDYERRVWLEHEYTRQRQGCAASEVASALARICYDGAGILVGGNLWVVTKGIQGRVDDWAGNVGFRRNELYGEISLGSDYQTGATILRAAQAQFDKEVAELAAMCEGQHGPRFWTGQAERCQKARERLIEMERMLGESLVAAHQTLTKLSAEETVAEVTSTMMDF